MQSFSSTQFLTFNKLSSPIFTTTKAALFSCPSKKKMKRSMSKKIFQKNFPENGMASVLTNTAKNLSFGSSATSPTLSKANWNT
jgi:hypothetical protein